LICRYLDVDTVTNLYMRLDVGFANGDLTGAASTVQRWLRQPLESRDDLELGGHYFSFTPAHLPDIGLCGVRVRPNYVAGLGWRLPHREDLPACAEIEICGPDLLELGRVAARGRVACGKDLSIAAYLVTRSPADVEDAAFPRAHMVLFGENGRPVADYPELECHLSFGLETKDLTAAASAISTLLQSRPVERQSEDLGGRYVSFEGATPALIRANQVSAVQWLYPRHRNHTLLLDITQQTFNLLEPGEFTLRVEESSSQPLPLIGYRIVGDLVRDRVPRLFSYERHQQDR
jgi:hypothetical protein